MTYERIMDDNFQVIQLQFHCQVERGTLPLYRWFLNNVPLTMRGLSHWVWSQDNSSLLVDLNPSMSGEIHCEAFNSFDKEISVSSQRTLISKEGELMFLLYQVCPVRADSSVRKVNECFCYIKCVQSEEIHQ